PVEHALRLYKGVVREWGVRLEVRRDKPPAESRPLRSIALERNGKRWSLEQIDVSTGRYAGEDVGAAMEWLSGSR
ncbi:MAG: hypothetical protein ACXVID_10000, partial [Thermoanaerobaculia bacterium]